MYLLLAVYSFFVQILVPSMAAIPTARVLAIMEFSLKERKTNDMN